MGAAESPEPALRRAPTLSGRYSASDLSVFTEAERRRFLRTGEDPQRDIELAWELLYRCEPRLFDRFISAERLHPALIAWLPRGIERIVEIGAGSGRLTLELLDLAETVLAVEPAAPLRELLLEKLARAPHRCDVRLVDGFFDSLPAPDGFAELVVTCSAFTPDPGRGGEKGLAEMERVCRPGGCVAIVWPNNLSWLARHGYRHVSFAGDMSLEFATAAEAVELIEIFHPQAAAYVRGSRSRRVPYEALGVNPPRDLAYKTIAA